MASRITIILQVLKCFNNYITPCVCVSLCQSVYMCLFVSVGLYVCICVSVCTVYMYVCVCICVRVFVVVTSCVKLSRAKK